MFYEATHRAVFEVEVNCYLKFGKVEYNLVLDLAKECKLLTKIGGENTLMDLYIFASQFASYANYARLIRDKYILRCLMTFTQRAYAEAASEEVEDYKGGIASGEIP